MANSSIFRWIDGRGWLILAPGDKGSSDIRAQALQRLSADGAVACALMNGNMLTGDSLLEDLEDLGAPSGYVVDLVTEDDATIEMRLGDAGLIVVESGRDMATVQASLTPAVARGCRQAYEQGAVVLIEGFSAIYFGQLALMEKGILVEGLGWLKQSLIVPTANNLSQLIKPLLDPRPQYFGVGIGVNSALALGPDGQVEMWGEQRIAVVLGKDYGNLA
jgi:hypothetical protein